MKTLIVYATKHGTTENAVNILKSKLTGDVNLVNIMLEPATQLEEYDIIILGGSIYMGKIQKKLSTFILINLPLLLKKQIGLFICAGEKDKALVSKELIFAFPATLFDHAIVKEVFGFELDMNKLNFFEKFVINKLKGVKTSIHELSETKIDAFAKNINKVSHL
ncbi:flavodoxin domain-containing protein [Clostridium algoriphilum]|uniref:flavodoxin domain-containing protein n=1 Tax=Clostridium algoriphilum TaxID=198347 RepID=UPI001CF41A6F|nr:flavodoxin domain-containing protein [Clostridium algoriphilum]MCB2295221.1 flavodoxin domain-containing protein [Clostridium algoriphilum]